VQEVEEVAILDLAVLEEVVLVEVKIMAQAQMVLAGMAVAVAVKAELIEPLEVVVQALLSSVIQ
jgi:hypothetical protein